MGLIPVSGGANYSGSPSYLIPARFATEFLHKYYLMTTFREIANTDFEETIRGFGDILHVRRIADISTFIFNPGMVLPTQINMSIADAELNIDHGRGWRFPMDPVLLKQTDKKDVFDKWAFDAARQSDIAVEAEMYANLPAQADATNLGNAAGAKTGMWQLGTTGSPLTIGPNDCVPLLLAMEQCLFENNVMTGPESGVTQGQEDKMYAVVPGWFHTYLMQAGILQAIYTGDPKSPLRTNAVGKVGPVTIYRSNSLVPTGKVTPIIFGVKRALSFALQLDIVEVKPNFTYFGDLMQGLVVYGYNTMIPTGMGAAYVQPAGITGNSAQS